MGEAFRPTISTTAGATIFTGISNWKLELRPFRRDGRLMNRPSLHALFLPHCFRHESNAPLFGQCSGLELSARPDFPRLRADSARPGPTDRPTRFRAERKHG